MKKEAFVLPQTRKCANCSLGFSKTEVTKCVICLPYKILSQFFFRNNVASGFCGGDMGIDTSILYKWICRLYLKATFPLKMVEIKAQQIPNKQRDQKYSTSAKPTGRPTEVKQCLQYNYNITT